MWFMFPKGVDQINVNLQTFRAEAEDEDGNKYFRAPDHFAPNILDLPGFRHAIPPDTDLEDLPQEDPTRDSAISTLGSENSALREENEELKALVKSGNDALRVANARIKDLEAQLKKEGSKS